MGALPSLVEMLSGTETKMSTFDLGCHLLKKLKQVGGMKV